MALITKKCGDGWATFRTKEPEDGNKYEYVEIDSIRDADGIDLVYEQDKYEPGKPWRWRIQIETSSDSDRNCYERIDLFDLLDWLKENKPDLLAERGLTITEKEMETGET